MIGKIITLLTILFIIFLFYKFLSNFNSKKTKEKLNENIVDLEKDPKTNEYKPKD